MHLVIVHYHLNPGGVTRIIQNQLYGLRYSNPDIPVTLITGLCPDKAKYEQMGVRVVEDSRFNYLPQGLSRTRLNELYDGVYSVLNKHIGQEGLLHFHNMGLGKNPVLTMVGYRLAQQGVSVLNHCHDFPEERYYNMVLLKEVIERHFGEELFKILYGGLPTLNYAVLNEQDRQRLLACGITAGHITLLPNPVLMPDPLAQHTRSDAREVICRTLGLDPSLLLVTYPTRAIRRKNIGEFIFLASLFRHKAHWLITLPPHNPLELPFYNQWKQFCADCGLDIIFEAGRKVPFETLLRGADWCITTSRREGFGMAYLEPWLLGTPVNGRNLMQVTRDFEKEGLVLNRLYPALIIHDQGVVYDFAVLDDEQQRVYIKRSINDTGYGKEVISWNPFLRNLFTPLPKHMIDHNRDLIRSQYTIEKYGDLLDAIYRKFTQRITKT